MICKTCGAEVKDDAIFCQACGTRIDSMKPCPKCGKLIEEGASFCNYCGTRIDGKVICTNCGAEMEGNFCTACGAKLNEEPKIEQVVEKKESPKKSILSILSNCFMFTGVILTFILLFTMSVSHVETIAITGKSTVENFSIFEFISLLEVRIPTLTEGEAVITTVSVIYIYIIIAAAMIVCLIMTIIATVRFSIGVTKGEVKIGKQFAVSLSFVLAVMLFISYSFFTKSEILGSTIISEFSESEKFSTYTQAMLNISVLFALASVILRWIKEEKYLSKIIFSSLAIILIEAFIFSTMSNVIQTRIGLFRPTIIKDSSVGFYSTAVAIYTDLSIMAHWKSYSIGSIHAINYAVSIGVAISFMVCAGTNLSSVFAKKEDVVGNIVSNSIFLGFSILWLVISYAAITDLTTLISQYSQYMLDYKFTCIGPELAVTLGVILLGISITGSILLKKKKI